MTISEENLQAMDFNDACRYLGYWGTRNHDGEMRVTKGVVRQKTIAVCDLIKCHPPTTVVELATELFTSKGMGVFRFSAALIEWSESELNDVKRLYVTGQAAAGLQECLATAMVNCECFLYLPESTSR